MMFPHHSPVQSPSALLRHKHPEMDEGDFFANSFQLTNYPKV